MSEEGTAAAPPAPTATTWVEGYLKAWSSNAEADIRALFTDDAVYEFRPNDPEPWRTQHGIVTGWLKRPDNPDEWAFEWHPLATEGATATIQGVTTYDDGTERKIFDNLWVITLEPDGRASHFTEWYMERTRV